MKNIELKGVKVIPLGFYRILDTELDLFEIKQGFVRYEQRKRK
jgi:hypothetical protein